MLRFVLAAALVIAASSCAFSFDRSNGLEPGSVQGRVVDETGKPVAFAVLARDGSPAIAHAGRDGTFTIRGLTAGPVALRFHDDVDGDGIAERAAIRAFSIDSFVDPTTQKPTLSAVLLGDVALSLTTSVTGHVFDSSGNVAPGAVVVVYRRSHDLTAAEVVGSAPPQDLGIEARSAAADDGSFVIPGVAPGAATVAAFADDGSATPAHGITVSATATDAGQLILGAPADRSVALATSPPTHAGVTVDIVRPGGDPTNAGDVVATSGPLGGGTSLAFTSPVGIWDLYAHDGARTGALPNRAAPASLIGITDVLEWGPMTFSDDDPCRRAEQDRDGDGVDGLPAPQNENDPTWLACASTCAPLFGAALANDDGTPKTCDVNGATYDCDDDDDGQPDVTEPFACVGICNGGGDRDGDGFCDDQDPFPLCKENEPAICKGAPAFTPPPPIYTSSSEGEGEGSEGEGEGIGEGEGEGSIGEGEGEGSIGEGEGEGAVDPCATNFGLSSQADVVNFAAQGCTHVNDLIIDSTGNPIDPVTSLAPLSALTNVTFNLSVSGTDIVDATGLDNVASVGGNLSFSNNTSMTSLALPALASAGNVIVRQAPQLTTFPWPPSLTAPGGVTLDTVAINDISSMASTVTHIGIGGLELRLVSAPDEPFTNLTAVDGNIIIDANLGFTAMPAFPAMQSALSLQIFEQEFFDAGTYPALTTLFGGLNLAQNPTVSSIAFPVLTSIGDVNIQDDPGFAPTAPIFPAATDLGNVVVGGYVGADLAMFGGITSMSSLSIGAASPEQLGCGITSLNGLDALTSVPGDIVVENCSNLTAVDFAALTQAGSLTVNNVQSATDVEAFSLVALSRGLTLTSLPSLSSVVFGPLQGIGALTIRDTSLGDLTEIVSFNAPLNPATTFDIERAPNVTQLVPALVMQNVSGAVVVDTTGITDLSGLDNLVNAGSVTIANNPSLSSFGTGLAQLSTVTGTFSVTNNPSLATMPLVPKLAQATELDLENEPFADGGNWPALTTLDHVELNNLPNLNALPSLPVLITGLSAYNITSTGLVNLPCLPTTTTIGVSSNTSLVSMDCAAPQTIGTMGFTNDPQLASITATLTAPLQGLRLDVMNVSTIAVPIADVAHDVQLVNSSIPTLDTFMSNLTSLDTLDLENTSLADLNGLQALTTVTTDFVIDANQGLCAAPLPQDVLNQLAAPPAGTVTIDPNCAL